MTIGQIDEAVNHFVHYSTRYQLSKDDEDTFGVMLSQMSKKEMLEVLFQIGANIDLDKLKEI